MKPNVAMFSSGVMHLATSVLDQDRAILHIDPFR